MKQLLLLSAIILVALSIRSDLSTKTPYEAIRGDVRNIARLPDAEPQQIWLLARHGARHFGGKLDTLMNDFLNKLYVALDDKTWTLNENMTWFSDWRRPQYVNDKELVNEGMLEHFYIAKRYKEAFPELFPAYYPTDYEVRATFKQRTIQSAYSFMYGLVDEGTGPLAEGSTRINVSTTGYLPSGIQIESNNQDILLRYFDNCPAYKNYLELELGKKQMDLFKHTEAYLYPVMDMSKSFGMELTVNDVEALFYLCAYEQVSPTDSNGSNFCNVLSSDAAEAISYGYDLKKYYSASYPANISYQISCVLLKEFLTELTDNTKPYLRFGHQETVLPFFALLGLFKDEPLLDYQTKDFQDRKMMLSHVVPFAANIAMIKYQAQSGDTHVQIIVNEHAIHVPACEAEYCTIPQLTHILTNTKYSCDFNKMCSELAKREAYEGLQEAEVVINRDLFYIMVVFSALSVLEAGYILFSCYSGSIRESDEHRYQKMPNLS